MTQRQKLELSLNVPVEVELLFDDPITGQNRYGDYFMYAVQLDGQEYSFFPVAEVHEKLKNLHKGDKAVITKTAAQKGTKLITSFNVQLPDSNKTPADIQLPSEEEIILPAENSESTDKYYDIMLRSLKDAIRIGNDLGGVIEVHRIGITLFIQRCSGRMGGMQ